MNMQDFLDVEIKKITEKLKRERDIKEAKEAWLKMKDVYDKVQKEGNQHLCGCGVPSVLCRCPAETEISPEEDLVEPEEAYKARHAKAKAGDSSALIPDGYFGVWDGTRILGLGRKFVTDNAARDKVDMSHEGLYGLTVGQITVLRPPKGYKYSRELVYNQEELYRHRYERLTNLEKWDQDFHTKQEICERDIAVQLLKGIQWCMYENVRLEESDRWNKAKKEGATNA